MDVANDLNKENKKKGKVQPVSHSGSLRKPNHTYMCDGEAMEVANDVHKKKRKYRPCHFMVTRKPFAHTCAMVMPEK